MSVCTDAEGGQDSVRLGWELDRGTRFGWTSERPPSPLGTAQGIRSGQPGPCLTDARRTPVGGFVVVSDRHRSTGRARRREEGISHDGRVLALPD